jgi:RimJ/RimL family protein N-acetyltransferase
MRDADAMRHAYVAPSLAHCASRLCADEALRSSLGFAPWVVRVATDGQIVGWGGLSVDPEQPGWGLEVSYDFARTAWGCGYATELVVLSLAHAFGPMAAPEVHAFAKPQNAASIRVLEKCGFSRLRFEPALERDHYLVTAQR